MMIRSGLLGVVFTPRSTHRRHVTPLTVLGLSIALTFTSAPTSAQSLINGGSVNGSISVPGEEDSYTFTANAGDGLQLRVADINVTTLRPKLTLLGPLGAPVGAPGAGNTVGALDLSAPSGGTYTVVVSDLASTQTGAYELHFTRAPGANEGGGLSEGGSVSAVVGLGDLDSYTISADAGDRLRLRIADLSSTTLRPKMTLYDPIGSVVGTSTGTTVAALDTLPLTSGGTYTVVVADASGGFASTGNYELHSVHVPGANELGYLIDGVTSFNTIDLGDMDSYTLIASAGQVAEITVTNTGATGLVPHITLYDPTGASLGSASGGTGATLAGVPLPIDGVYTLVVTDASSILKLAGSGPYSIVVTGAGAVPAAVPLPSGTGTVLAAALLAAGLFLLRSGACSASSRASTCAYLIPRTPS